MANMHPLRAVGSAFRGFANSMSAFVLGSLIFAFVLIALVGSLQRSPLGSVLVFPAILGLAGLMRMATEEVRNDLVGTSEMFVPLRRHAAWVIVLGVLELIAALLLAMDVVISGAIGGFGAVVLALLSAYALLIGWTYVVVAWPILLDPARDDLALRDRLRLALVVVLLHPMRSLGLGLLVAFLLGISISAIVPVLFGGIAISFMVAAHAVLPAADAVQPVGDAALDVGERSNRHNGESTSAR